MASDAMIERERLRAELRSRDRRKRPANPQMVAALRSAGLLRGQWREPVEPARERNVRFQES